MGGAILRNILGRGIANAASFARVVVERKLDVRQSVLVETALEEAGSQDLAGLLEMVRKGQFSTKEALASAERTIKTLASRANLFDNSETVTAALTLALQRTENPAYAGMNAGGGYQMSASPVAKPAHFSNPASIYNWVNTNGEKLKHLRGDKRGEIERLFNSVSKDEVIQLAKVIDTSPNALKAFVHLVLANNKHARVSFFALIRGGNAAALRSALDLVKHTSFVLNGLCVIAQDPKASSHITVRAALLKLEVPLLIQMASTDVEATQVLDSLAEIGHGGVQRSLARQKVGHWISLLKMHPHPDLIHTLVLLARRGNKEAKMALAQHVDRDVIEFYGRRYPLYVTALGEMVEVGVVSGWSSLTRLANDGVKTAVAEVERLRQRMEDEDGILQMPLPPVPVRLQRLRPRDLLARYRETQSFEYGRALIALIEKRNPLVLEEVITLPIDRLKMVAEDVEEALYVLECFAEAGNAAAYDALIDLLQDGDVDVRKWFKQVRPDHLFTLAQQGVVNAVHMLRGLARYENYQALFRLTTIAKRGGPLASLALTLVRNMDLSEIARGITVNSEDQGDIHQRLDCLEEIASCGSGTAVRLLYYAAEAGNHFAPSNLSTVDAAEFLSLAKKELEASAESPSLEILKILALFQNESAYSAFSYLIAGGYVQAGDALLSLIVKMNELEASKQIAESFLAAAEANTKQIPWLLKAFEKTKGGQQRIVEERIGRYDIKKLKQQISSGDMEASVNMVGLALHGHRDAMIFVAEKMDDFVLRIQGNPAMRTRLLQFNRRPIQAIAGRGDRQAATILEAFQRLSVEVQ